MRPDDVPVLGLLRQSLSFHADRQRLIAENVANANTPGYTPKDISDDAFQTAVERSMRGQSQARHGVVMRTTEAGHISRASANASTSGWQAEDTPDSETTINGNSVVLEEQMVRAQDNRMRYESALTLYQKSLGLIRMAIRPPAR